MPWRPRSLARSSHGRAVLLAVVDVCHLRKNLIYTAVAMAIVRHEAACHGVIFLDIGLSTPMRFVRKLQRMCKHANPGSPMTKRFAPH